MRTLLEFIMLCTCLALVRPAAGQLGSWTAHTSMRSVSGVADAGADVWVSTSGGVFSVDKATGEIGSLTAVEGLHAVAAATIAYDAARAAVWVGYADGVVDRIDVESRGVESYLDIARATQYSRRGVNRIVVRGDSLFVCTEFGVVVFDPEQDEVRDAYTRLGALPVATPVYDVVFAPDDQSVLSIWAATGAGLAFASLDAANLQDPSTWTIETLEEPEVLSLAYFENAIYAGTANDVYLRESPGVLTKLGFSSSRIPHLDVTGGLLFGVTEFLVIVRDAAGALSQFEIADAEFPSSVALSDNELWVGTSGSGLVRLEVPPAATVDPQPFDVAYEPEGPSSGIFSDLSAARDGSLWAAGVVGSRAFHRLAPDGSWTDFDGESFPVLADAGNFTHVESDVDRSGWAASEGGGLAWVRTDGTVEVFDESNSSLRSATGFPGFVVVGDAAVDGDGGVWATTRGSPIPFHYRAPGGQWTGLPPYVGEGLTSSATAYGEVYVDAFDQKWVIVREETNFRLVKGLAVVDTGADPEDAADDSFRFFGTRGGGGQGLPGRGVTSVAEDRDGLMWVGTDEGLAYFINTGVVARDPSAIAIWPQRADRSEGTFLFLGLPVNDLAVDPANRLWIATNDGVRVVEAVEDGFEEVLRLTADSSPLLSDIVLSIEIIPDRGEAFFATESGLVSVEIDAVSPASAVEELLVYPNPVRPGSEDTGVTISGLVDRTDVSIVTGLGQIVARLSTRGGQARWDLRDAGGRGVPSGVYLIVAVAENGEGTAYGKVAVIR